MSTARTGARWLGAGLAAGLLLLAPGGCARAPSVPAAPVDRDFPKPDRPVSRVVSNQFSTEAERDNRNEAQTVMDLAGVAPGMTVADIGAGEGYYTVRLAQRVGARGRVLAQDIDPGALARLGARVERDRLLTVSIKPGTPADPRLPARSFDRIFLIHMYHEIESPYAFMWRLRPALKPGGQVIVVDLDRPTDRHGIPPSLLECELGAVGFRPVAFHRKSEISGYYAQFEASGEAPQPGKIEVCRIESGKVVRGLK